MHRVLMVSPHFPPDTSAATHRVRLLAPHLPRYGWEPTVLSVDPRDYEGRLDPELARLVPDWLRVVRCRAWSARWTRRVGVGDLGLRALTGLYRAGIDLLRRERFDVLFITIYPTYTALLGRLLRRRFGVPFVLDYQDPWIGAWGETVGGGRNGRPDMKSRLTRAVAQRLEPYVIRAASAITAVSAATYEDVLARNPGVRPQGCSAIPLGGEPADFACLRQSRWTADFDPTDGHVHVCCVGTLLPTGFETLRAVLRAAAALRESRPDLYRRLRLRFYGTSNQTAVDALPRVQPTAREFGIDDCVSEVAPRIDYVQALMVQTHASALLMMGSAEKHYTASKLYPGLLARRPILAVYHEASSVVEILRRLARPPAVRLVTYDDVNRAESRTEAISDALSALIEAPTYDPTAIDENALADCSAQAMAGKLAAVLDRVIAH